MVGTLLVYDDVATTVSDTVADIQDFTDDVDSSVANQVGTIQAETEQISADAPLFPTQDIIDFTEQVSADAPLFPTQDIINFTEQLYTEITEPGFGALHPCLRRPLKQLPLGFSTLGYVR